MFFHVKKSCKQSNNQVFTVIIGIQFFIIHILFDTHNISISTLSFYTFNATIKWHWKVSCCNSCVPFNALAFLYFSVYLLSMFNALSEETRKNLIFHKKIHCEKKENMFLAVKIWLSTSLLKPAIATSLLTIPPIPLLAFFPSEVAKKIYLQRKLYLLFSVLHTYPRIMNIFVRGSFCFNFLIKKGKNAHNVSVWCYISSEMRQKLWCLPLFKFLKYKTKGLTTVWLFFQWNSYTLSCTIKK